MWKDSHIKKIYILFTNSIFLLSCAIPSLSDLLGDIPCRLMINYSLPDRFIMDHSFPVKRLIVIPLLVPLCRKFLPTLTFISLIQYLIKQFNVIRFDLFVLFRSTYQISDIPDSLALPGTPCNNFQGYCDVFQKCRMVCDVIM